MRILVTGGAGFQGSHICEKYAREGHTVFCIDDFSSGDLTNVKHLPEFGNFKLLRGDIRDRAVLEKTTDLDVIFHMAAQIHVDRSYVEPELTYDVNVRGTQNVLEFARFHDIERVIHASSSEVYGSALYAPMDEDHPLNAPHPYGASKIAADRMCYSYVKTYGMDIRVTRFFNIFGPRQKDIGYGGVISIFARRIMNNLPPIIFGDGEQTRDYTYIEDAIRGYDAVLMHEGRVEKPINFGSGQEITINYVARKLLGLLKKPLLRPIYTKPRKEEIRRLVADNGQAKKIYDWEPLVNFDDGMKKFMDWFIRFGAEVVY